jgi:hypothetical protein
MLRLILLLFACTLLVGCEDEPRPVHRTTIINVPSPKRPNNNVNVVVSPTYVRPAPYCPPAYYPQPAPYCPPPAPAPCPPSHPAPAPCPPPHHEPEPHHPEHPEHPHDDHPHHDH